MADIKAEDILKRSKERTKEFDELLNSPRNEDETLDSSVEYGIHKFVAKVPTKCSPSVNPILRVDQLKAEESIDDKENSNNQRRSGRVQNLCDRFEMSSKTGKPLHPDDDIINVASDLARRVHPIGTKSPLVKSAVNSSACSVSSNSLDRERLRDRFEFMSKTSVSSPLPSDNDNKKVAPAVPRKPPAPPPPIKAYGLRKINFSEEKKALENSDVVLPLATRKPTPAPPPPESSDQCDSAVCEKSNKQNTDLLAHSDSVGMKQASDLSTLSNVVNEEMVINSSACNDEKATIDVSNAVANDAESREEEEKTKFVVKSSSSYGDEKANANCASTFGDFVDSSAPIANRPYTPYSELLVANSFARESRPITPNSEVLGSLLEDIYHDIEKFQKLNNSNIHTTEENKSGENNSELQHTISFYRRQTQNRNLQDVGSLPRRPSSFMDSGITQSPNSSNASSEIPSNDATLKHLQEALIVQQDHIYQASRALAFCRQHENFRYSTESVDAQRALLIATEKRRAYLSERDRVINARQCATEIDPSEPRGTLAFSFIAVRLSRDFINMYIQQHSESRNYYFIVLIKHGEHVFHTSMVSSTSTSMKSGYIEFPQYISVSGLTNDFVVTLEVHGLRGYPTARVAEKKRKTIRKMVADAGSAGSSLAIRGKQVGILDSGFQKLGYLSVNRSHLTSNRFLLSEVLYPLDGVVMLNLQCLTENSSLEFRGFLSLYQIVSGLGAWTRFWCRLGDKRMSFWRYPEDEERNRDPIVVLALEKCLGEVSEVSSSVASFPHSMQVDIASATSEDAPAEEIRMLFAADTTEDMMAWMEVINKAIRFAKIWT